jgi:Zn-dependent protease
LQTFLLIAPILLLSMVAHEYAHGYAALRQGDDTALKAGRLTWNPLKHIDPVMTIMMPIITYVGSNHAFAFGGAKPVPVNPALYRNYRRGDIIVSLAGVTVNLALAVIFSIVIVPFGFVGQNVPALLPTFAILQSMCRYGVILNLVLVSFNLIPIPPLDGSHVFKHLLPGVLAEYYVRFQRFGFLALILLLTVGQSVLNAWMTPAMALNDLAMRTVSPFLLAAP